MASTKEKKLTKYEQNTARRNARSIGDSGTSQTAQSSVHKSDKQRQLEQFAQNFEQKYGKPIRTANHANTAKQSGAASKSAVENQNSGWERSNLTRNEYDSRVRSKAAQSDNDAAKIIRGMNTAEVMLPYAQRQLEQVIQKYGGNRGSDGAFTFQTQEGVDAYNRAATTLQETRNRYEQTQRAYEQLQLQYADAQVKLSDLQQSRKDASKKMATQADSVRINQLDQQINEKKAQNHALKEQLDQIEKYLSGARDATLYDLTVNSFQRGRNNAKLGVELNDQMNGKDSEAQKYLDRLNSEQYNFMPEGALERAVSGGIEQLGQMFANLTDPNTLATALATAGTAYAASQLAGGAILPDEIVSLPAAAVAGLQAGTANQNRMVEAGLAYQEMIENGISEDTAKKIANYVGLANAALEFVQLDELVKAFRVLGKSGASSTVLQKLAKELAERGVDVAKETAQEVAQEGVTIAGAQLANKMETGNYAYGADEVIDRLRETAESSALAFVGMNVPAAAYNVISGRGRGSSTNQGKSAAPSETRLTGTTESETLVRRGQSGEVDTSQPPAAAAPLKGSLWGPRETEVSWGEDEQQSGADAGRKTGAAERRLRGREGEPSMLQVEEMADTFGREGAAAFREAAKNTPAEALPDLYDSFVASYNSASRKITPEQADKINRMPADLRTAAYQAGIADYSASAAKQAAKLGLVKDQTYRQAHYTAKTERTLDTLAKAAGVSVRIVDKIPAYDENGNLLGMANARYHNGAIEIARNAKDPAGVAFTHEIVHRVRQTDPEAYRAMARLVIDSLSDERYYSALDSRAQSYRDLDESNMQEELVADAFGRVLGDSEYLDRIVRQNRTVWQRILDTIRDFIDRIRHVSSIELNESERQEFSELAGRAEKMASLLENALDRAKTAQRIQAENAAQEGGAAQYSIRKVDGKSVVWIENSSLTNKKLNNHKAVADFIARHIGEVYTIIESGQKVYIGPDLPGEYTQSRYTTYLRNTDRASARAKNKAVDGLGELIETATNRQWEQTRHTQSKDAEYGMYRYDGTFAFPVKGSDGTVQRVRAYDAELLIRNASDGKKYLYDIVNIKENTSAQIDLTKKEARSAAHKAATGRGVSDTSISGTGGNVNGRGSTKTGAPEGGTFTLPEMANAEMNTVGAVTNGSQSLGGSAPAISPASATSVAQSETHGKEKFSLKEDPDIRYSLMSSEISEMSNRLTEQLQVVNARAEAGEITQEEAAAQKMAILQAPIQELIAKYGQMEPGERPFRDITIPRKTGENMRVSRTVRTVLEAEATPDELVPDIEQLVAEGAFSYEAYGDEQSIKDAENKILEVGYETALTDWTRDVHSGNVSKFNTALGWRLYDEAANRQDMKTAMTVLTNLIEHQRNAAQAVQATRILKQMPPSAQLYGVQRSIQNLQDEINRRYGTKKGPELKIDEDLAQQFMEAQSQQERDAVLKDIYRDIGRQMPSSFLDKWNAWRYFAMLGNPRTHIRNIGGNLGFAPVVAAKNLTATAIESAVYRVTGGRIQRTKGAIGVGKADRSLLKACWGDYANVQDVAMGSAKYNDSVNANQYIQEGRRIFKSENRTLNKLLSPIEKASRGNSRLLEAEDLIFFKPHYAYALAQYCKANHISAEEIQSGKIPDAARAYAIREAQKATYRDTNQFSQIISNLGRTDRSTEAGKAVGMVVDGILPFRRTPANILVRGLEYSPLGFLNALKIGVKDVKAGKATAADVIDALSSSLTGTGLLTLGIFLAAEGIVRGHGDDDDENKFLELQGHQQYSLEAGGQSFTLDWLAPEALPFFVGVNIYEQGGLGATMSDWAAAVQNISEPLLEMSCLQSLNDMFDNIGYVQSEGLSGLTAALAGAATSYLTQAIPTVFGQLERTSQRDRMTTFTNQNDVLTTNMQYTLGKASARIPGWDYQQIPYIDAWGRTEGEDSTAARAVDNFLNPAYRSEITDSSMENELLRLYEQTGNTAVFPSRAGKTVTVSGEKKYLNANEYVQYATEKGQMSYEIMTKLINNTLYKNLSDEDKVEVISDVYSYANAVAKTSVSDYTPESWIQKASAAEAEGIPVELYIVAKHATGSVTEGIPSRSDPSKSIENSTSLLKMQQLYNVKGLTDEQRQTLYESFNISESVRNYNKAAVDEKIQRMRQRGR